MEQSQASGNAVYGAQPGAMVQPPPGQMPAMHKAMSDQAMGYAGQHLPPANVYPPAQGQFPGTMPQQHQMPRQVRPDQHPQNFNYMMQAEGYPVQPPQGARHRMHANHMQSDGQMYPNQYGGMMPPAQMQAFPPGGAMPPRGMRMGAMRPSMDPMYQQGHAGGYNQYGIPSEQHATNRMMEAGYSMAHNMQYREHQPGMHPQAMHQQPGMHVQAGVHQQTGMHQQQTMHMQGMMSPNNLPMGPPSPIAAGYHRMQRFHGNQSMHPNMSNQQYYNQHPQRKGQPVPPSVYQKMPGMPMNSPPYNNMQKVHGYSPQTGMPMGSPNAPGFISPAPSHNSTPSPALHHMSHSPRLVSPNPSSQRPNVLPEFRTFSGNKPTANGEPCKWGAQPPTKPPSESDLGIHVISKCDASTPLTSKVALHQEVADVKPGVVVTMNVPTSTVVTQTVSLAASISVTVTATVLHPTVSCSIPSAEESKPAVVNASATINTAPLSELPSKMTSSAVTTSTFNTHVSCAPNQGTSISVSSLSVSSSAAANSTHLQSAQNESISSTPLLTTSTQQSLAGPKLSSSPISSSIHSTLTSSVSPSLSNVTCSSPSVSTSLQRPLSTDSHHQSRPCSRTSSHSSSLDGVVVVPFGWKRIMEKIGIVYYSPSGVRLASQAEVCGYITTEGTCKCGLECPLQIDKVFNFSPMVPSKLWRPDDTDWQDDDLTKLCNHKRKIHAMATLQIQQAMNESSRQQMVTPPSTDFPASHMPGHVQPGSMTPSQHHFQQQQKQQQEMMGHMESGMQPPMDHSWTPHMTDMMKQRRLKMHANAGFGDGGFMPGPMDMGVQQPGMPYPPHPSQQFPRPMGHPMGMAPPGPVMWDEVSPPGQGRMYPGMMRAESRPMFSPPGMMPQQMRMNRMPPDHPMMRMDHHTMPGEHMMRHPHMEVHEGLMRPMMPEFHGNMQRSPMYASDSGQMPRPVMTSPGKPGGQLRPPVPGDYPQRMLRAPMPNESQSQMSQRNPFQLQRFKEMMRQQKVMSEAANNSVPMESLPQPAKPSDIDPQQTTAKSLLQALDLPPQDLPTSDNKLLSSCEEPKEKRKKRKQVKQKGKLNNLLGRLSPCPNIDVRKIDSVFLASQPGIRSSLMSPEKKSPSSRPSSLPAAGSSEERSRDVLSEVKPMFSLAMSTSLNSSTDSASSITSPCSTSNPVSLPSGIILGSDFPASNLLSAAARGELIKDKKPPSILSKRCDTLPKQGNTKQKLSELMSSAAMMKDSMATLLASNILNPTPPSEQDKANKNHQTSLMNSIKAITSGGESKSKQTSPIEMVQNMISGLVSTQSAVATMLANAGLGSKMRSDAEDEEKGGQVDETSSAVVEGENCDDKSDHVAGSTKLESNPTKEVDDKSPMEASLQTNEDHDDDNIEETSQAKDGDELKDARRLTPEKCKDLPLEDAIVSESKDEEHCHDQSAINKSDLDLPLERSDDGEQMELKEEDASMEVDQQDSIDLNSSGEVQEELLPVCGNDSGSIASADTSQAPELLNISTGTPGVNTEANPQISSLSNPAIIDLPGMIGSDVQTNLQPAELLQQVQQAPVAYQQLLTNLIHAGQLESASQLLQQIQTNTMLQAQLKSMGLTALPGLPSMEGLQAMPVTSPIAVVTSDAEKALHPEPQGSVTPVSDSSQKSPRTKNKNSRGRKRERSKKGNSPMVADTVDAQQAASSNLLMSSNPIQASMLQMAAGGMAAGQLPLFTGDFMGGTSQQISPGATGMAPNPLAPINMAADPSGASITGLGDVTMGTQGMTSMMGLMPPMGILNPLFQQNLQQTIHTLQGLLSQAQSPSQLASQIPQDRLKQSMEQLQQLQQNLAILQQNPLLQGFNIMPSNLMSNPLLMNIVSNQGLFVGMKANEGDVGDVEQTEPGEITRLTVPSSTPGSSTSASPVAAVKRSHPSALSSPRASTLASVDAVYNSVSEEMIRLQTSPRRQRSPRDARPKSISPAVSSQDTDVLPHPANLTEAVSAVFRSQKLNHFTKQEKLQISPPKSKQARSHTSPKTSPRPKIKQSPGRDVLMQSYIDSPSAKFQSLNLNDSTKLMNKPSHEKNIPDESPPPRDSSDMGESQNTPDGESNNISLKDSSLNLSREIPHESSAEENMLERSSHNSSVEDDALEGTSHNSSIGRSHNQSTEDALEGTSYDGSVENSLNNSNVPCSEEVSESITERSHVEPEDSAATYLKSPVNYQARDGHMPNTSTPLTNGLSGDRAEASIQKSGGGDGGKSHEESSSSLMESFVTCPEDSLNEPGLHRMNGCLSEEEPLNLSLGTVKEAHHQLPEAECEEKEASVDNLPEAQLEAMDLCSTNHTEKHIGVKRQLEYSDPYDSSQDSGDESLDDEAAAPQYPRNFNIGDLVWGPMRGHPSWPGKLVHEYEVKGHPVSEDGKLWVKWFNDPSFSQVEPANLKTLSEGLEAHHRLTKKLRKGRKMNPTLEVAIQMAMEELDRQMSSSEPEKTDVSTVMPAKQTPEPNPTEANKHSASLTNNETPKVKSAKKRKVKA